MIDDATWDRMSDEDCRTDFTELRRTLRVARKPHPCKFCRDPINPGDKYTDYAALLEGRLVSYKYHGHSTFGWCPVDRREAEAQVAKEQAELAAYFAAGGR